MVDLDDPLVRGFLRATGHAVTDPRQMTVFPDGFYVMAYPLMFHWTVILGHLDDAVGYEDRWCFASRKLALDAVANWPTSGYDAHEPVGWHRHPSTGRRRPDGEAEKEYVEW
jgi:hypothetical protein